MSYDVKSYELALDFLFDCDIEPKSARDAATCWLAQRIQTGIEDDLTTPLPVAVESSSRHATAHTSR